MNLNEVKKNVTRFAPIILNSFRSILIPFISILFSYIITHYFSKELWGNFVTYLLFILITSITCDWGSKTFLMRQFSKTPKNRIVHWQQMLISRLPLCFFSILIIPFIYDIDYIWSLGLWILGIYIYHSFFPIIFYERQYVKHIIIEIIGFLILVLLLYTYQNVMNLPLLIKLYMIHIIIKASIALFLYRSFLKKISFNFNSKLLLLSLPFFWLGISGFLQSKIDVYVYSFFYDETQLGEYQIISGLFIFSQSVVTMALFPYIKNIYRMSKESILTLKKNILIYGLWIHILIVILIYFILSYYFEIELTMLQVCISFFIGFPSYIYTIHIFFLFKKFKELIVAKISIVSLIINLLLSLILLSFNYNITGVLVANALAQVFCMLYYLRFKIND